MAEVSADGVQEGCQSTGTVQPGAATVEQSFPQAPGPRVDERLEARANQLDLLVELNAALATAIDVDSVFGEILQRLVKRARLQYAAIYRMNSDAHLLQCVAHSGDPGVEPNRALSVDGPELVAWAARAAEGVYAAQAGKDPRCLGAGPAAQAQYAVPLRSGSNVLGVLHIGSNQPEGIRAVTRKLVDQLAAQAAVALERSELYQKLRASEERFRSIFEQGCFGVALVNFSGEFSTVNPAFARILGHEPEELCGRRFTDVTHPEDLPKSLEGVNRLLEGKATQFALEARYVRKSGEATWCAAALSVIRDSSGEPACFLLMLQDIHERRRTEEERARLQQQLFQAQKMEALGALAGGIAHDFNNLLSVMLGFASLVRSRLGPDDPLQEPIRMIEQSAEGAADLTRQLLGFARPEKQQVKPVCVQEVLEYVVTIVSRTFDRQINVRTQWAPELPWVEAEPNYLEQAILNLCINARDAMPDGGNLTLKTAVINVASEDPFLPAECLPGPYTSIAVQDTGKGIAPEAMPRIFEPFFTTKESGKGTGLGLAMVYGFVKNHGGFLRVESELGRGSRFTIYLPAITVPGASSGRREPSRLQRGSGTVLVVDDEPLVRAFAEEGLKKLGYSVLAAESGPRALEIYGRRVEEIDCVLLDMVMPEISGVETCRRLRAINPRVRVIFSSGYSAGAYLQEAREAGGAEFIGKPYSLEGLSIALQKTFHH